MNLRLLLIITLSAISSLLYAQPSNYWSMGSNTESSILAGAIVGGGSGITSIFYNPAGISEIKDNKISINASLFHFNFTNYEKMLDSKNDLSYLDYQVQPRFFSFVFHPKKYPKLSMQYAVFSRGQYLNKIYYSNTEAIKEIGTNLDKHYSVNFNYENRYSDTWFGFGSSYKFNDKWTLGASLMGSAKTLVYYENASIDILPTTDTSSLVSKYLYTDRQDLYVISLMSRIGAHYKSGKWSFGINISLPSLRLYGDGYHRREVSMINIRTEDGIEPDFVKKETNYHIVSNFKEPLSISLGLVKNNSKEDWIFYFSTEFFFPLEDYKAIDNSRVANIYTDEYSPGSEFLTFQYGADAVLNASVGAKKVLKENFSVLMGFKTDFASYKTFKTNEESNHSQYIRGYADLYHLTSGVLFEYKRADVLLGLEYTFGMNDNQYQFRNFDYPGVYDTKNLYALQDYPKPEMKYSYNGIGIYFGLALNF